MFFRETECESSLVGALNGSEQFECKGCFNVSSKIVDVEVLKSIVLENINNLDVRGNSKKLINFKLRTQKKRFSCSFSHMSLYTNSEICLPSMSMFYVKFSDEKAIEK